MTFISKIGRGLRFLGEKVASGAQWLGNKVGGTLLSLSPAVSAFNPALGAGMAAAGGVAEGIGAIGGAAMSAMHGGIVDADRIRGGVDAIRSGASGVRAAYNAARGPSSQIERNR